VKSPQHSVAIVGSGPAALMAGDVLCSQDIAVTIYEKRKNLARKLLIAGSSGLNVTFDLSVTEFHNQYSGPADFWKPIFKAFSPDSWLGFIQELGIKTFKGTSHRYFVEGMKAGKLVSDWKKRLSEKGVRFVLNAECIDFSQTSDGHYRLYFRDLPYQEVTSLVFCLGGASWEPATSPIDWPQMLTSKNLKLTPFSASNVGFAVDWPKALLKEAEGLPLKNIVLKSQKGEARGDAMMTSYGIEGTPVYAVGEEGELTLDLKPDLTLKEMVKKMAQSKENFAPIRKIQKQLKLCPASFALLYHMTPESERTDLQRLLKRIKVFPIHFQSRQGLEWAISSAGGLKLEELNEQLMIKKLPGVFAAGEMLDWDTVTGGFLIQACVSQGYIAGQGALAYLNSLRQTPKR
jgi:uncharacterized flavoprotein (TIGR03862 family)